MQRWTRGGVTLDLEAGAIVRDGTVLALLRCEGEVRAVAADGVAEALRGEARQTARRSPRALSGRGPVSEGPFCRGLGLRRRAGLQSWGFQLYCTLRRT